MDRQVLVRHGIRGGDDARALRHVLELVRARVRLVVDVVLTPAPEVHVEVEHHQDVRLRRAADCERGKHDARAVHVAVERVNK